MSLPSLLPTCCQVPMPNYHIRLISEVQGSQTICCTSELSWNAIMNADCSTPVTASQTFLRSHPETLYISLSQPRVDESSAMDLVGCNPTSLARHRHATNFISALLTMCNKHSLSQKHHVAHLLLYLHLPAANLARTQVQPSYFLDRTIHLFFSIKLFAYQPFLFRITCTFDPLTSELAGFQGNALHSDAFIAFNY